MGASAGLIALGLGGAAGSLGAGILSSKSASSNNSSALAFNRWSQLESQRYNKEMYEQQLKDQESMYNKYQSPSAIAQQLRAAGINPAAATSQVAGGNMPSVPSASGSSPLSAPPLQNEGEGLARGFESAVNSLGQMYASDLHDAQAQETRSLLEGKVHQLLKQNRLTDLQSDYQEVMNTLTQKYGDLKWSSEIQENLSTAVLNYCNGDYAQAQADVARVMKKIGDEDLGIKQEERANIAVRIAKQLSLIDEEIATEKTKQVANRASANESNASARNSNALARINEIQGEIDANTKYAKTSSLIESLLKDKAISKADKQEAKTRLEHLERTQKARDNSVLFREVDDCLEWLKNKVSIFK